MAITITHAKTNAIADWTQPQLDAIIAGGAAPLPPVGTTLADVTLPSDWNDDHVIVGLDDEYVPYTGATANVDLGAFGVTANYVTAYKPSATATYLKTANSATGVTATDGFDVGVSSTGVAEVRNREVTAMQFFNGNVNYMSLASNAPTLTLDSQGSNSANAGTIIMRTASGSESFTQTFDASANQFNMLYGANNVMKIADTTALSLSVGHACSYSLTGTATKAFASGYGSTVTLATGKSQAASIGVGCSASNLLTASIGLNCIVSGQSSVGIGQDARGTNQSTTGIGNSAWATGAYSLSLGAYQTASGYISMSVGYAANATASQSGIFGYSPINFDVTNSTADSCMFAYEDTNLLMTANKITASKPIVFKDYTVATLPTGTNYMRAFVSDALAPTFGAAVVGGGAVKIPVYYDGAWKVG